MKYLSIKEIPERQGISFYRIQILCKEGRIHGIIILKLVYLSTGGHIIWMVINMSKNVRNC